MSHLLSPFTEFTMLARVACYVAVFIVLGVTKSEAIPITDSGDMNPLSTLVDFETFAEGIVTNPLTIGEVTFTAASGSMSIRSVAPFPADGTEVSDKTLHPHSGTLPAGFVYQPLTLTFANPVSEVGLGWFDPNLAGNKLQAFDAGNVLLEEAFVENGPTGGVHAAFIGIRRNSAEIARLVVVPSQVGDVYTIDNVLFFVPEPCTSTLALMGILTLSGSGRRWRKCRLLGKVVPTHM